MADMRRIKTSVTRFARWLQMSLGPNGQCFDEMLGRRIRWPDPDGGKDPAVLGTREGEDWAMKTPDDQSGVSRLVPTQYLYATHTVLNRMFTTRTIQTS